MTTTYTFEEGSLSLEEYGDGPIQYMAKFVPVDDYKTFEQGYTKDDIVDLHAVFGLDINIFNEMVETKPTISIGEFVVATFTLTIMKKTYSIPLIINPKSNGGSEIADLKAEVAFLRRKIATLQSTKYDEPIQIMMVNNTYYSFKTPKKAIELLKYLDLSNLNVLRSLYGKISTCLMDWHNAIYAANTTKSLSVNDLKKLHMQYIDISVSIIGHNINVLFSTSDEYPTQCTLGSIILINCLNTSPNIHTNDKNYMQRMDMLNCAYRYMIDCMKKYINIDDTIVCGRDGDQKSIRDLLSHHAECEQSRVGDRLFHSSYSQIQKAQAIANRDSKVSKLEYALQIL